MITYQWNLAVIFLSLFKNFPQKRWQKYLSTCREVTRRITCHYGKYISWCNTFDILHIFLWCKTDISVVLNLCINIHLSERSPCGAIDVSFFGDVKTPIKFASLVNLLILAIYWIAITWWIFIADVSRAQVPVPKITQLLFWFKGIKV